MERRRIGMALAIVLARSGDATAAEPAAPTITTATRAPRAQRRRPPQLSFLTTGDGYACARVYSNDGGEEWRCWAAPRRQTPAGPPPTVVAHRVPWPRTLQPTFGPHDVCTATGKEELRCWSWPAFVEGRAGDELPPPKHYMTQTVVGGTFRCVRSPDPRWTCDGDNGFGQLGDGKRDTTGDHDGGGDGIPGAGPTLGFWHGCIGYKADTLCWGRGDAGQLGYTPSEHCRDGTAQIGCSHTPRATSLPVKGMLYAGDLYTCATSGDGLACWGGSRDGVFGTAAACPPALRRSWPTLTGSVGAPAATCSPTPVVPPGFKHASYDVQVGPRGICAVVQGHVHCAGAIPTPDVNVRAPHVNTGDEPSACGIAGSDVVCWGGAYSPPDDPSAPTTIGLADTTPAGVPVIDARPPASGAWSEDCLVNFGCDRDVAPVPPCPKGTRTEPWAALGAERTKYVNEQLSIRGTLEVGSLQRNDAFFGECLPNTCCARDRREVTLRVGKESLPLEGFDCRGDQSRLCCNAPAFGQTVVVTGRLANRSAGGAGGVGWQLRDAKLCALR